MKKIKKIETENIIYLKIYMDGEIIMQRDRHIST